MHKLRKPDAYKGKGVRYADVPIKLKPGKTGNKFVKSVFRIFGNGKWQTRTEQKCETRFTRVSPQS